MKYWVVFYAIALVILNSCTEKAGIRFIERRPYDTVDIRNDEFGIKSVSSALMKRDPKQIKDWPPVEANDWYDLKEYTLRLGFQGRWMNYAKHITTPHARLDNCYALTTESTPAATLIVFKGEMKLVVIQEVSSEKSGEKLKIMVPYHGVYEYTCKEFMKTWNRDIFSRFER